MKTSSENTIYTIGHSTRTIEEFLEMLKSFEIKTLVDIRKMPGSRKYPQFNQDALKQSLEQNGVEYIYETDLGGRRKVKPDSKNTSWNNLSFRGYADYMETDQFKNAVIELEKIAIKSPTVYMCSEAVWWRCHRSMVSDYLKAKGWNVLHIMAVGKAQEHKYTAPANVENGEVNYEPQNQLTINIMATKFKVGDKVSWNSEAGKVSGTIIKVHLSDFDYKGYTHHASKDDPQYEIKSSKTEHIAAHKGTALTKE